MQARPPKRHPLFGLLRGKLQIAPGTDLTLPADPVREEKVPDGTVPASDASETTDEDR